MTHHIGHHQYAHHDPDPPSAAALKGASLAFHKRKSSAPPSPSQHPIDHGALTAATLSAQSTGSSIAGSLPSSVGLSDTDRNIVAARLHALGQHTHHQGGNGGHSHGQFLSPPSRHGGGGGNTIDPKNASFIAATLAASRSASPSPKARTPRKMISVGGMSRGSAGEVVDEDPIAPTGSLISMFESGAGPVASTGVPLVGLSNRTPTKRSDVRRSMTPPAKMPSAGRTQDQRSPSPLRTVVNTPAKPKPKPKVEPDELNSPQSVTSKPVKPAVIPRSLTPPPKPTLTTPIRSMGPSREGDNPDQKPSPAPVKPAFGEGKALRRSLTPPPKPKIQTPIASRESQIREQGAGSIKAVTNISEKSVGKPFTPPPKPVFTSGTRPNDEPSARLKTAGDTIASPASQKPSKPPKPDQVESKLSKSTSTRRPEPEAVPFVKKQQDTSSDRNPTIPQSRPVTKLLPKAPSSPQPIVSRAQTEIISPRATRISKPQLPPPTPPQYQKTTSRPTPESEVLGLISPGDPQKKDTPRSEAKQPPTPPKPRGSTRITRTAASPTHNDTPKQLNSTKTGDTSPTSDVFVSAPTSPEHTPPPLVRRKASKAGTTPSPTRSSYANRRPSHAQSSHNLGIDSLTSAIVAGSLASSRLTPSNTGSSLPPLPPRQKSPRLRQTMRSSPAHNSDDENDHKRTHHRHKLRSGKHSHHEGSRKRWRDEVTARERKRYEAVWASNRGALLPTSQPSSGASTATGSKSLHPDPDYANSVANVVVRDIWRRSRLPEDELAEVWDLVDREKRGFLSRQEFVVGMWLIDQRLKGRKIPQKVSNSVWGSANGVQVIGPRRK